jgi:hypothetical protein
VIHLVDRANIWQGWESIRKIRRWLLALLFGRLDLSFYSVGFFSSQSFVDRFGDNLHKSLGNFPFAVPVKASISSRNPMPQKENPEENGS